jgi:protein ImuA
MLLPATGCRADPALLAALNAGLRRLEGGGARPQRPRSSVALGVDAVDRALPWQGLPAAGLHEVLADDRGAALGFATVLLARFAGESGTVAWCRSRRDLYGPGVSAFGLDVARLLVVRARNDRDLFWALEESLRSGVLAAVLGEVGGAPPIALRRLQLAAEAHGTAALLLRSAAGVTAATPALTRWRVGTVPAAGAETDGGRPAPIRPRWRVTLERCRHGGGAVRSGTAAANGDAGPTWIVDWCDEEGALAVAADLRHRPADAPARRRTS